jgi:hypothetical protein
MGHLTIAPVARQVDHRIRVAKLHDPAVGMIALGLLD